jgi:hypothetical protein
LSQFYDEIQVFDGVAEPTGVRIDRAGVRGRAGVCRSLSELGAKARRLGDGFYYLASPAWPADTPNVDLNRPWAVAG